MALYRGKDCCAGCGSKLADLEADYGYFSVPLCGEKCRRALHEEINTRLAPKQTKTVDSESSDENSRRNQRHRRRQDAADSGTLSM
jgi:hypothetical protein